MIRILALRSWLENLPFELRSFRPDLLETGQTMMAPFIARLNTFGDQSWNRLRGRTNDGEIDRPGTSKVDV